MTRNETTDIIAEQVATDARPDHVATLVHALRIGGDGFAVEVAADFPDVASDEERGSLIERARVIADGMGPIDPVTPGALPLQQIAEILGETYWVPRAWVFQGCPHEGYGSSLRCDPAALAAWCAAKADGITSEPEAHRFRTLAQHLADHAALQAA
ncbi:hypothetical protein JHFBIEKO_0205 [Methylobacterium mesophilicum]|uniref:hypothetical protein n=1 Tax=Methylobacterium mesophilicum TaxID=39956 RepID=UPI001EE2B4E4|nr:hypothetical protein [Methylobacterium mesophilicum]GJE19786.1 hypothetical protein JHFBIEKO_0205 [Methylobacterium mesophilicum]